MAKTKLITDSHVVDEVLSDFRNAHTAKQSKERLFTEIYRRYRSYLDVSRQTTRSTLFIPESFTLVETVAPRLTARKPTFRVLPRESSDIKKADIIGQVLDYQYDCINLQQKIKRYSKQALIYGTSFMKMGWDAEKQKPAAEPVDLADIWGDPGTCDWDHGFIVHRYIMSLYELKSSSIKYKNLNMLQNQDKTSVRDDVMRQDRRAVQDISFSGEIDGIEILEWWGFVDGRVHVRAVANRTVLIRDEESPFILNELPFVPLFDQEVPFDKWGIGEIEPVMDLQDEENTTRNQRIDEKNLSIHNMWVVDKSAGIDYKKLVSKPGGIILATNINGIKPLEKQNITQNSIEEIRLIKDDIRNTTGVNDYVRGNNTGGDTATETAVKTQEANMRFAEKVNNLEIALKRIGKWMIALNAQYLTDDITIRITGKYGLENKQVSLEDIRGQYDVDIETGSSLPANPDLRRQQLRELVATIAPFLTNPNGIPDGLRELLRLVIQAYDLKNTDEVLQGAEHPMVSQIMAQLDPSEFGDVNPQLIQQEIKRMLMQQGRLGTMPNQQPAVQAVPDRGTQQPAIPTL